MNEQNENTLEQVDFTQEDYLRYAQAKRLAFIRAIDKACKDEDLATLDPDRQANYLAAIRDIEKQVFVLQKLKQEEETNTIIRDAAIADLILRSSKEQAIRRAKTVEIPNPDVLPVKPLIPGETEIGDKIENYEQYLNRTGQRNPDL